MNELCPVLLGDIMDITTTHLRSPVFASSKIVPVLRESQATKIGDAEVENCYDLTKHEVFISQTSSRMTPCWDAIFGWILTVIFPHLQKHSKPVVSLYSTKFPQVNEVSKHCNSSKQRFLVLKVDWHGIIDRKKTDGSILKWPAFPGSRIIPQKLDCVSSAILPCFYPFVVLAKLENPNLSLNMCSH